MNPFSYILSLIPLETAYAHCDIPCGIYDPTPAQIAAHTVIRMTNLIDELKASGSEPSFDERKKIIHRISRLTKVKEEHAELVKEEIRIIWGDYFKEENLKDYPDLHKLVFKIMKLSSRVKQEVDPEDALELLSAVQEFAEIFYKSKGPEIVRVPSGYPTGGEIVSHK
ncbi:MAG: superoxide dismutase, Ni [Candidatus Levybacteria bacterium RIFCSPLOWO2_12_FULL_39_17]|nr:MAG: Nickel-dependent superoxide dismutase [Candidatus Levybacteria bacterium GW2011_GWA1_39_11]KKR26185.1 MAG: Nickel-dependent superoxide dismutase [Microgenomates group bacterium GW2011_GWC1_39_7]OGH15406.1 MAG: superoxide dismutase, Ni [Candidatus Levybacteria bacterium RIFCSPHIGHO2_01_FULL_38_96]OGH36297.1 MAG: superoxide dismutase, Ni [Candidatus Levybacteria bacterium RIFCSPLOWO2_01_FULL_38_120]OGH46877.1 MAG: superoxide dismutase, Ni [Candidatus Levybacteria bacterium RIFCSPLOWO2_12_